MNSEVVILHCSFFINDGFLAALGMTKKVQNDTATSSHLFVTRPHLK